MSAQSHNFLLLLAFSLSPLPLGHRLPCGALLYYHFLPLLSTPFLSFFPLFSSFLPFLFDVSSFLSLFSRFFWVLWFFVGRDGCGAMIRSMQNLGTSCTGNGFILFACTKRTKSTPEVCGPLDSGDGSKLYGKIFFVAFPAFVPQPVYGTTRFFGCFEPLRKGYCSTDARLMFFENGMPYCKLSAANVFEKNAARYICCGANSKLLCVV